MEMNGVMVGSEDPTRLAEYYTKIFGEPAMSEDGFSGWKLGSAWLTVYAHDQVTGKNAQPGRVMWILESADVQGDFDRFKSAGASVVLEPYHPQEDPSMLVATFADPDDNYFQLMSPAPEMSK